MASARQIEANRANARASTGPKTRAGKRRSRSNAYRHGLAAVFNREALAELEQLARQWAGETADPMRLQRARQAAHADLTLARINVVRIALVQRAYEFGYLEFPTESYRRDCLAWINQSPPAPMM